MNAMASQITGVSIVYSTVCSNANKKKDPSKLRVTGLCEENSPVTGEFPRAKGQQRWKSYHLMTSSCTVYFPCPIMFQQGTADSYPWLSTYWGRVTHICVGNLTIIGSDNGLSPGRRQAIIWTNAGILLIGPLGTNFSEIEIEIQTFSLKKMRLKVSSAKCRPFCLGLNVLTWRPIERHITGHIPYPSCWLWLDNPVNAYGKRM